MLINTPVVNAVQKDQIFAKSISRDVFLLMVNFNPFLQFLLEITGTWQTLISRTAPET